MRRDAKERPSVFQRSRHRGAAFVTAAVRDWARSRWNNGIWNKLVRIVRSFCFRKVYSDVKSPYMHITICCH